MNDQDHSMSLSDPDRSLVLSHFLTNFLQNLVSCHTAFILSEGTSSQKKNFIVYVNCHKNQNLILLLTQLRGRHYDFENNQFQFLL
jgi:hypothetical protein